VRFRREGIIFECETLWANIVKVRDFGRCQVCGLSGSDAAHLFGRENWVVKFDPDLGACLCTGDHYGFDKGPPDVKEEIFEKIIARTDGRRRQAILRIRNSGKLPILTEKAKYGEIRAKLRIQLREAEETAEMNYDIE
jgi:hypothetical protein